MFEQEEQWWNHFAVRQTLFSHFDIFMFLFFKSLVIQFTLLTFLLTHERQCTSHYETFTSHNVPDDDEEGEKWLLMKNHSPSMKEIDLIKGTVRVTQLNSKSSASHLLSLVLPKGNPEAHHAKCMPFKRERERCTWYIKRLTTRTTPKSRRFLPRLVSRFYIPRQRNEDRVCFKNW